MPASPSLSPSASFVRRQLAAGKESNRLINEKSPYLLQHAFNPVQWLPWGDEAFDEATRLDKPVFLSVGYSTCHWCHVMAHESFEDEEVAAFLNQHFIAVKVDREERPDIDQLYMTATQAITGSGGWPMSVFLLPDQRPFYAGTYFPPQAGYGRPGFLELLRQIQLIWQEERPRLTSNALALTERLTAEAAGATVPTILSDDLLDLCLKQAGRSYDRQFGGFGRDPKFPRPAIFDFLLRFDHLRPNQEAREMVLVSLRQMASGGIYDHLGGGFHRYSVDRQWQVPHFEKMLYDQAQLASLYLDAFLVSGDSFFADIADSTLDYVLRDMTAADGAFFSAEDADSVAANDSRRYGEGLFYLWEHSEIIELLGDGQAAIFNFLHGVEPDGNALADPMAEFTGKNILYRKQSTTEAARHFARSEAEIRTITRQAKSTLLQARQQRPRPHLDDKIITAWNGLMISALAKGYRVTGNERYLRAATNAAHFIEKNMLSPDNSSLRRRFCDGEANFAGQLDDYAFFSQGLLDLYSAAFDSHWLALAVQLSQRQIDLFSDPDHGAFFDSPHSGQQLLIRLRNDYDGAEPSGNAITAMNLLRLGRITDNAAWRSLVEDILSFFAEGLMENPFGRPALAAAYDFSRQEPRQIVIAGRAGARDTEEMLTVINSRYLPDTTLLLADNGPGQAYLADTLPSIGAMRALDQKATAYVCQNFTCRQPLQSPADLRALL